MTSTRLRRRLDAVDRCSHVLHHCRGRGRLDVGRYAAGERKSGPVAASLRCEISQEQATRAALQSLPGK